MSHLEQLRAAGLKATGNRAAVLAWLAEHRRPATADDIKHHVRAVDVVTIYRMLDDFVTHGLVQDVRLHDGIRRVEYIGERPHHHHFVCDRCGDVAHLHLKHEQQILKALAIYHGLRVRRHEMTFSGLCRSCSRHSATKHS